MKITLRFFASVREQLGTSQEHLTLPDSAATLDDVRALLVQRGGVWANALGAEKSLRMALNHVMCRSDAALEDGCEVAFFPPVTGG